MLEASLERLRAAHAQMKTELQRVIVGQDEVLDQLLLALLTRGHCLLVGVPGLAKTLMISSLARTLELSFNRIQFTPDLMPSDITGTELLHIDPETSERSFRFAPGPLFTNVLLADEINRTPPKTQAALPEAQLDRFMFMVKVGYPSAEEEREILRRTTGGRSAELGPVLRAEELFEMQAAVREIPVADAVYDFVLALTRGTRVRSGAALDFAQEWITWGAGPRASQCLVLGAKARAVLQGRDHVAAEDVRAVAHPVLRHRIIPNFTAQAEGIDSDAIIDRLLTEIAPGDGVAAGLPGVSESARG